MTHPIVVTGAASGLGAATARRLRSEGRSVIGVDVVAVDGVDIVADLGSQPGRDEAVAQVVARSDGALGGVVSCAALGPESPDPAAIVSVNWFGALHMLDALLPALAGAERPAAVAIASIGAIAGADDALVDILLSGDEAAARTAATDSVSAYSSTKRALALAVRQRTPAWGQQGVRLNAVAPGRMTTPMYERIMASPIGPGVELLPTGIAHHGTADEIAGVVCFLLGPDAVFVHGQIVYVDGGAEALMRPDLV
jgi:NAD(P)-dependent dehydrogenase (short-subunit alcohol dehydrogenase family)